MSETSPPPATTIRRSSPRPRPRRRARLLGERQVCEQPFQKRLLIFWGLKIIIISTGQIRCKSNKHNTLPRLSFHVLAHVHGPLGVRREAPEQREAEEGFYARRGTHFP